MLGMALASQPARSRGWRLSVLPGHALGKGTETCPGQRIAREIRASGFAVVLRPMPDGHRWIELHGEQGKTIGLTPDVDGLAT